MALPPQVQAALHLWPGPPPPPHMHMHMGLMWRAHRCRAGKATPLDHHMVQGLIHSGRATPVQPGACSRNASCTSLHELDGGGGGGSGGPGGLGGAAGHFSPTGGDRAVGPLSRDNSYKSLEQVLTPPPSSTPLRAPPPQPSMLPPSTLPWPPNIPHLSRTSSPCLWPLPP